MDEELDEIVSVPFEDDEISDETPVYRTYKWILTGNGSGA